MISDDKIAPENIGQVLLAMRTAANVSIVETKEFARAEKEREATKTRESDTKRKAEEAAMRAKEIETERIKQGELLKRL